MKSENNVKKSKLKMKLEKIQNTNELRKIKEYQKQILKKCKEIRLERITKKWKQK